MNCSTPIRFSPSLYPNILQSYVDDQIKVFLLVYLQLDARRNELSKEKLHFFLAEDILQA
jgi:hypothetical protein